MSEFIFENDCKRLISTFSLGDSSSFQAFCNAWLKHEFFYIFHGFQRSLDAIEFTDNFIPVVTQLFSTAANIREQLGAFYLLYILYHKQPALEYTKIRLKVSDWIAMKEFYGKINSCSEYTQAKLIFWTLWRKDAFRFAISKMEQGLEIYMTKTDRENYIYGTGAEGENDPKKEVIKLVEERNGIVSAIQLMEMGYNEMKEGLKDSKNDKLLPPSTCAAEILKGLREINDVWNFEPPHGEASGESRRKMLKSKAYVAQVTHKPTIEKKSQNKMSSMWKKLVKVNADFLEVSIPLRDTRSLYQSFANRTLNHTTSALDELSTDDEDIFSDHGENDESLPEIN
ncbi:uncharacterized protein DMENIID0001_022110 [Sergentomyia squamirostris]